VPSRHCAVAPVGSLALLRLVVGAAAVVGPVARGTGCVAAGAAAGAGYVRAGADAVGVGYDRVGVEVVGALRGAGADRCAGIAAVGGAAADGVIPATFTPPCLEQAPRPPLLVEPSPQVTTGAAGCTTCPEVLPCSFVALAACFIAFASTPP
jgi:hypothetical protein